MAMFRKIFQKRWFKFLAAAVLIVVAVGGYFAWKTGYTLNKISGSENSALGSLLGSGATPDEQDGRINVLLLGMRGANMPGGGLLAVGLNAADANAFLPFAVTMNEAEHINAYFDPPAAVSLLAGVGPADVHNRAADKRSLVTGGAEVVGDGVLAVAKDSRVVFCQMAPWQFGYTKNYGLKRTFRRSSCLVSRLLGNLGVSAPTPLLERFSRPVGPQDKAGRWLQGLYLDKPEEWDDPHRFFRW